MLAILGNGSFFLSEHGYYLTKAEGERQVLAANAGTGDKGLRTVALRLAHVFGIDDDVLPLVVFIPTPAPPQPDSFAKSWRWQN